MRTYDFSPLWRSTIGFDRLFDLAESAQRASENYYPLCLSEIKLARTDDEVRQEMA
jgi:hypothetical protein